MPRRSLGWLILAFGLAGCTVTYGPGDLPEDEPPPQEAVCAEDDTRPGCHSEEQQCIGSHDYLCDGP